MEPMKKVFFVKDNIFSPLGIGTEENYRQMVRGNTAIQEVHDQALNEKKFYAALLSNVELMNGLTRFETIASTVVQALMKGLQLPSDKTVLIVSTTKGNISLLNQPEAKRLDLHQSSKIIADQLGLPNVITVSNACISGVMALIVAHRFLCAGKYDHALVVGADELSKFIVSGFQSLYALGDTVCKPFDKRRNGISLGEAAGAILVSSKPEVLGVQPKCELLGSGAITNDANHISGPSRTGHELAFAINSALKNANITSDAIDFVSAHGTATLYNDEMETKAFHHAELNGTPVNSLKGYFGHTLGAAGIVETIITTECLIKDELIGTKGFSEIGVSLPLNVIKETQRKLVRTALKTASGFGGCNAAIVLRKLD
jgi:3-oxoacyl-[acyl-carrier-protein] synthase I